MSLLLDGQLVEGGSSGTLLVSEDALAAGASPISLVTGSGAGRIDLLGLGQLMAQSGNGSISQSDLVLASSVAEHLLAHIASPVFIVAGGGAGGSLGIGLDQLVSGGDHQLISGGLVLTGSVGEQSAAALVRALVVFLGAVRGAGSSDSIHLHQGVSLLGGQFVNRGLVLASSVAEQLAADGALVVRGNVITTAGGGNHSVHRFQGMLVGLGDHGVSQGDLNILAVLQLGILAAGAGVVLDVAGFLAGSSLGILSLSPAMDMGTLDGDRDGCTSIMLNCGQGTVHTIHKRNTKTSVLSTRHISLSLKNKCTNHTCIIRSNPERSDPLC